MCNVTNPPMPNKTPWPESTCHMIIYGVGLHSLVITEDTAFVGFHYVYLYLTFVYNLSARLSSVFQPRQ